MSRWVLVPGGAQRLGREICLAFARAGWNVACHFMNSGAAAERLAEQIKALRVDALAIQSPLNSADDAELLFDRTVKSIQGRLLCVVNNASTFQADDAARFSSEGLMERLQTNLVVPVVLSRCLHAHASSGSHDLTAAVIHLLDQKVFNLNPDYFSYTLSKLALERSVAQMAQALAPVVRVNAVAPGLLYPSGPQSLQNFEIASDANLLRRRIDPEQVAQTVRFLAENPCITGVTIAVDNGQHLVPLPRDIMFVVDELLARRQP